MRARSGHLPLGLYVMCGGLDWQKWWSITDIYEPMPMPVPCSMLPKPKPTKPKILLLTLGFSLSLLLTLGYSVSVFLGVVGVLVFCIVGLVVFAIKEKMHEAALRRKQEREAALREAVLRAQEHEKKLKMEAARSPYLCFLSREFDDFNT